MIKNVISKGLLKTVIYRCSNALPPREKMNYDVLIVGGGVAGLSTAIKLKQQQQKHRRPISVCLIEKGSEIGYHILSGNCFQPRGLDELFPDWRQMKTNPPPIDTKVTCDQFSILLTPTKSLSIPHWTHPKTIDNYGNYVISLGKLCQWLAERATQMGVDIFPGTPGAEVLYTDGGAVRGVATGDFGVSKEGKVKENFQRGIQIEARQTVFAEGCRGSLTGKVVERFNLRGESSPQIYGIGLKEVWEVSNKQFKPGKVLHTVGWPMSPSTYGGSFMYHINPNQVHMGMVISLDYKNPYLNPYEQFQRLKNHPKIREQIQGGKCISYGARALNEGGYFSIPKLVFPGGVLVGCSAGFLNVMKIKGAHNAIKSGIVAGESLYEALTGRLPGEPMTVKKYEEEMKRSWVWKELYQTRNFKNSFKNIFTGLAYSGIFKLLGGREPFSLQNKKVDSQWTEPASKHKPIDYPKHDRKYTFDLLDNLSRSGTNHQHDQPSHLVVKPDRVASVDKSLKQYAAPQEKFCPAKVYEFVDGPDGKKKLQINAQNCLHCKTCSIKMVDEYIEWKTPEGRGGPQYTGM